jgi:DNA-binding MarR family transcriptional regulator
MASDESSPLQYTSRLAGDLSALVSMWWAPSFRAEMITASGQPLTVTEARLLWELGRRGTARPGELAALMEIGAPAVTKVLAKLRDRDLIIQEADADDRRVRRVRLTDRGTATTRRLFEVGDTLVDDAVAEWAPEKVRQLAELLAEFVDAARDLPAGSAPHRGAAGNSN